MAMGDRQVFRLVVIGRFIPSPKRAPTSEPRHPPPNNTAHQLSARARLDGAGDRRSRKIGQLDHDRRQPGVAPLGMHFAAGDESAMPHPD